MAKRISKYDLEENFRDYLVSLWKQTVLLTNNFEYPEEDLSDATVVYVRHLNDLQIGIDEGPGVVEKMQRYKIKEQTSLRKNTLNYNKKYYKNERLIKIKSYCQGDMDVIFCSHYCDGARFLIPFTEGKFHYPTYTHVQKKQGNIIEEYMCSEAQIVYSRYEAEEGDRYRYISINYAPRGTYPILGYETGIYEVTEGRVLYTKHKEYTWYGEFDAERKGLEFEDPQIDGIERVV